MHWYSAVLLPQ